MSKNLEQIFKQKFDFNDGKTRIHEFPDYLTNPTQRQIYVARENAYRNGLEAALDMVNEYENKNTQLDDEIKRLKNLLNSNCITIEDLDIHDYKNMYEKQKEEIDNLKNELICVKVEKGIVEL